MSTIYQQEPPTSGKVILKTNYGDIEIELWASETPRTCRNFIQLCMEGYYDNTIFHRIIKNFMVQGGDPTGTGKGGQSIYGAPFMDEYHTRLRFSHRGIVAMANESKPNTNQSQFFMTVDACPWLDKKHTIFGKVEGNTIYNLLKLSDIDTDKGDRPLSDPIPKINRVEVTINPFDDIVPRNLSMKDKYQEDDQENMNSNSKKRPKQIIQKQQVTGIIKNKNLLSFDEDVDEGESQVSSFRKNKIKSSHDALVNDPSLSKQAAVSLELIEEQKKKKELQEKAKENLMKNVKSLDKKEVKTNDVVSELQLQMKNNQPQKKAVNIEEELKRLDKKDRKRSRSRSNDNPTSKAIKRAAQKRRGGQKFATKYSDSDSHSNSSESESDYDAPQLTEAQQQSLAKTRQEYDNLKADLLSFKQNKIGTLLDETNINVQARLSALDLQRQKFINQMKMTKHRENETLSKLKDFQSKIRSKETKQDTSNWMSNKLKFHIDSQRAYDVNKAQQYQERVGSGGNFENFIVGGNENKKYANAYSNVKRPDLGDDVVQGMNLEEFVSMKELIDLATKNKEGQQDEGQERESPANNDVD